MGHPGRNGSLQTAIVLLAIGLIVLWLGGWRIAWAEYLSTSHALYLGDGVAVKFNGLFYGVTFKPKFFDSPMVSWMLGGMGATAIAGVIEAIKSQARKATGGVSPRTDGNLVTGVAQVAAASMSVVIAEDALPNRKYAEIGPIEVRVKRLTFFHKDPTTEQANSALTEKAMAIGADAVVNIKYERNGISFTNWGYLDARGYGVKFAD